jgi:DNA-directed RNA polymerase specialized sigma24 family protein
MMVMNDSALELQSVSPEELFTQLYERAFPGVAAFVSRQGGSFDDAKDFFHDAMVIYYEILTEHPEKIHTSEEAYILGIVRHLWIRKNKQDRRLTVAGETGLDVAVPGDYFPSVDQKRLLRILAFAGKQCMDLLRTFYYGNMTLKQVAGTLGYANEHTASARKYTCLEKIRKIVKEKSLTYDDFIE